MGTVDWRGVTGMCGVWRNVAGRRVTGELCHPAKDQQVRHQAAGCLAAPYGGAGQGSGQPRPLHTGL